MATTNKAFRVKSGLIVEGAELKPAAGTTTYPPILLTSGTNLTTATAGAFEYDGTNFYLTPASTRKTVAFTDSVLTSSVYLGTTAVALNRSSGSLSLAGVSIDGAAGSVTNAVTFTNTGGATAGTTYNGGTARTIDYSTLGAAPLSHTHGNITNAGAIGSAANLVAVTTTSGVLTTATSTNQGSTTFLRGDLTWVTPTNTNYYPTALTYTDGTSAGPVATIAMTGASNITASAIPSASASVSGVVTTGAQTFAGVKTFNSFPQIASGLPSNALDLVNKQYVDNIASGINAHDAVIAATTTALTATYSNGTSGVGATLTNSGTQAALVIDNVSLASGDRVLVKNQGTTFQNGIYSVTTVGTVSTNWVLTRTSDYDQSVAGEVAAGDTTFVVAPAAQFSTTPTNQNTGWTMNSPGTISIGSSAITFAQSSGSGTVTAGTGISVSGNQVSVDSSVLTTTSTQTGITNKTFTSPAVTTSLTTGSSSFDLINTTATTVNFAGAATTLNLGTGSFSTLRTINIGSSASGTGNSQTINLGVNSTNTAANTINIGGSSTTATIITGDVKLPTVGTSGFVKLGTGGILSADTNTYITAASPALTGTPTVNSIAGIVTASGSTTGTTALTLSTVYASGTYNGGEFIIKATNSTNIEITKVLVITDGTNVYLTSYGDTYVSADLVNVDFTYTGANVNMVVTPVAGTTGTTSVKVTGTLLAV